jgi:hypothetical protein
MLEKIYTQNKLDTKEKFVDYYNSKFRARAAQEHSPVFFKISVNGKMKTHIQKIWDFFTMFPEIDLRHYTDCVFQYSEDLNGCLPHRFLSKKYVLRYSKYIQDKNHQVTNKDHLHLLVELELKNFLDELIKGKKKYMDMFNGVFPLASSISLYNFPPVSILAISKSYMRYYLNANDKTLPNPEALSYIVCIVKQYPELLNKLKQIIGDDFTI